MTLKWGAYEISNGINIDNVLFRCCFFQTLPCNYGRQAVLISWWGCAHWASSNAIWWQTGNQITALRTGCPGAEMGEHERTPELSVMLIHWENRSCLKDFTSDLPNQPSMNTNHAYFMIFRAIGRLFCVYICAIHFIFIRQNNQQKSHDVICTVGWFYSRVLFLYAIRVDCTKMQLTGNISFNCKVDAMLIFKL